MDMIKDKMVVAIKVGGKVLRETKDLVTLPFGSEFTVLVKNLNSRRAKFRLDIDGTDVLGGTDIIANPNSEVELKRFIRHGNMTEGNAFKFIERTQAIEDSPRGIKVDDGVVRVEFWFETVAPEVSIFNKITSEYWGTPRSSPPIPSILSYPYITSEVRTCSNSILRGASASVCSTNTASTSLSDVGITVPGSKVNQQFDPVYGFNSEPSSSVIIIRLAGSRAGLEVTVPDIARTKQKCSTCSHMNKANAKFCNLCGTSLELL
jgi:hypothetical protein